MREQLGGWLGQARFQWLPRDHLCLLLPDFRARRVSWVERLVLQRLGALVETFQETPIAAVLSASILACMEKKSVPRILPFAPEEASRGEGNGHRAADKPET